MPFFALRYTAELDNIAELEPEGGCDDPYYAYHFKLKCENCGEITQKESCVILSEDVPLPHGRGTANLVQKCKLCGRDGTIEMIPCHGKPLTLELSQAQQYARLMVFECRGFEPLEFRFGDGWSALSTSGTIFKVDLSEGEFADYDEKSEKPVGITELRADFKVVQVQRKGYGRTTFV